MNQMLDGSMRSAPPEASPVASDECVAEARGSLRVSVIVPMYNYETYVAQTIESALAQTLPFHEIIVVNDGSTDGSLAVAQRYSDSIKIIDQANGGQMKASMTGLAAASGNYVYVLDADDYIRPELMETVAPYFVSRPVKLQFQIEGVNAEGKPLNSIFPIYPPRYDSRAMIEDNCRAGFYVGPPTSGNIYRRDFLERLDLASLVQRDSIDGVPNLVAPYFGEVVSLNVQLASVRSPRANFSQWSTPTRKNLEEELAHYERRWGEARSLLAKHRVDLDVRPEDTAFFSERELLIAGLSDSGSLFPAARKFIHHVRHTRYSGLIKICLIGWALLLACAPKGFRQKLVLFRRSSGSRPKWLNKALVAVKRLLSKVHMPKLK